jgi:hypothetical protein
LVTREKTVRPVLAKEEPKRAQARASVRAEAAPMPVGSFAAMPVHSSPTVQRKPNKKPNQTGLPDNLKAGVESLSGVAMDEVKVHYNSAQPAQLGALAYARGSEIHLGPGQERYLPHEAWHVVQQAQGRVKPTVQMKGGAVNDDANLEAEADRMGAKAMQFAGNPLQSLTHRPGNGWVAQLGGDDKEPPKEGSLRPTLGKALMSNLWGSNWFATGVFKMMNFAMFVERQPLAPEHNEVLHQSLVTNKNGILKTLMLENPFVMKSTGSTPIYLMGKYMVHKPLEFYLQYYKKD